MQISIEHKHSRSPRRNRNISLVSDQRNDVVVSDPLILTVTREKLIEAQKNDLSLKCFKLAEKPALNNVSFLVKDGLMMQKWHKDEWNVVYQVVVPSIFCQQVLSLAHNHLLSGHLGLCFTAFLLVRFEA